MDDLLDLEDRFQEQGREEGRLAGIAAGYVEGRLMGCEKGFNLQMEVGYYQGMAESLLLYMTTHLKVDDTQNSVEGLDDSEETACNQGFSPRMRKALENLRQSILLFPSVNNNQDLEALMRSIRIKFKLARSLLQSNTTLTCIPLYSPPISLQPTQDVPKEGPILSSILNASSLATPEERMKSIEF